MQISWQDPKFKIVALVCLVLWSILLIVISIYIYRAIFVIPWKGVVREAEQQNILNLNELSEEDQTIVKLIYEMSQNKDSKAELWQKLIALLNQDGAYISSIDGMTFYSGARDEDLFAVMIDNANEILTQQRGLEKASIVWHYPTEGSVSRLLALYRANVDAYDIGPIRSTRPYFINMIEQFKNIPLLHAGGSPQALQMLPNTSLFDIDEEMYGVMYRDNTLYAPHNLYAESDEIKKLIDEQNITVHPPNQLFAFNPVSEVEPDTSSVNLTSNFTPPVTYTWTEDHWERAQAEITTQKTDGSPLDIQNIVIIKAEVGLIEGDGYGRVNVDVLDNQEAQVLTRGQVVTGNFIYDQAERSFYLMRESEYLELTPGQTWIEVLPVDAVISKTDIL